MTINERFAEEYGEYKISTSKSYTLTKIKDQSPVVYSADEIMKAGNPRDDQTTRCDDFVLCSRASDTGIYIVEIKGGARKKSINQLQAGANFISKFTGDDCFVFLPVLVAKNIPPSYRRLLLTQKITLGKETPRKIKHVKINGPLPSILPR